MPRDNMVKRCFKEGPLKKYIHFTHILKLKIVSKHVVVNF